MLLIAATPIGNLGDTTERLRSALETVPVIACEDTRVAGKLLHALGIENHPRLIALHDHNEKTLAAEIVALAKDEDLLLLSDAGMPTVSDPGYSVIREAIAAGVDLTVLPGPSAPTTALALSGLPTDRFTFEGFLPRKTGEARKKLAEIRDLPHTLIFFESPKRVQAALELFAAELGKERQAAVARELTKKFEEVLRGTLGELVSQRLELRGEICIVIEGAEETRLLTVDEAVNAVLELTREGMKLSAAAAEIAENTGHSKNTLYKAALAARHGM